MNIVLWIVAGLLAALFLMAGFAKVSQPKDKFIEKMTWAESFSPAAIKAIGAVEILGALGLILPAATGIAPILTPLAAVGLAITMVLAAVVHARRGENQAIITNIVIAVAAIFVAAMRFGPYAF